VQLVKAFSLRPIIVNTRAAKHDLALKIGAKAFINFKEVLNATAEVIKIAGGKGAHSVFVTALAIYSNAIRYIGRRVSTTVIYISFPLTRTMTIRADPSLFYFKNLTIKRTLVGSIRDTDIALDFTKRGLLR
jgi:alcohol dehydrogenase, propanol-preferring